MVEELFRMGVLMEIKDGINYIVNGLMEKERLQIEKGSEKLSTAIKELLEDIET